MKALSVRQPWAWAIMHAGKDVENRTRITRYRGPLAIHATKCTRDQYARAAGMILSICGKAPPPWEVAKATFGHVIGTVTVTDSRCEDFGDEMPESPWADDFSAWWMLADQSPCIPFPVRGSLGLFYVPDASIIR